MNLQNVSSDMINMIDKVNRLPECDSVGSVDAICPHTVILQVNYLNFREYKFCDRKF
jgi:hypothetical protein